MHLIYLIKELSRRKTRTATNVLVVAVLVALLVVLTSLMNAYTIAIYLPFKDLGTDLIIQKSLNQAADMTTSSIRLPFGKGIFLQDEIVDISAAPHVEDVSKSLILWQFDNGKFISIEGVESASFTGKRFSSWVTSGRFLEAIDGNKIVIEKHYAKFYGYKLGDSLTLGNASFDIVGIIAAQGESQVSATNIYMNLSDAQQLINTEGYNQIYVKLDALSSEDAVRSEISRIDNNATVVSSSTIAASLSDAVKIYNRFHILGSAILAIIVAFILFQVSATGLMERRKEIGIMQTVGWTSKNIGTQIISEVFWQTVIGCIIGIIISMIVIAAIGSLSVQTNLPGDLSNNLSTVSTPLIISTLAITEFSALALVISAAVSLLLIRRLSGMKPVANLKNV
jgi:putative ABC transport system permease protein